MKTGKIAVSILAMLMLFFACINLQAATYEVGPTKPLTAIGQVPWESLQAGDTVLLLEADSVQRKVGHLSAGNTGSAYHGSWCSRTCR